MPFVSSRGQRIHYEVRGDGPTVLFQHGLFSHGGRWQANGYVDGLACFPPHFRVVCVDSLGHGDSDKPSDASLYTREARAGDLVRVFDAVGADRAHLVGYSMGGWMATGVAIHHPERLASLTIGGWDPMGGVDLKGGERPPLELVLGAARARLPDLVAWVTPEVEPALSACWNALFELDGASEALASLASRHCPVMLWSGVDDTCHAPMKALAEAHRLTFLSTRGDHASAVVSEAPRVLECLRTLFGEASAL